MWQFNLYSPFNGLMRDMRWNEITYCLDNPYELSFTVETENAHISLFLLLQPFLLMSSSNVFAPLALAFSSGQATLWVRFLYPSDDYCRDSCKYLFLLHSLSYLSYRILWQLLLAEIRVVTLSDIFSEFIFYENALVVFQFQSKRRNTFFLFTFRRES